MGIRQSPSEIMPGLWIGSYADSRNIPLLNELGITCVLDVAGFNTTYPPNFRSRRFFLDDDPNVPINRIFPQTNAFIWACLKREQGVLVHCYAGISRSVTVVVAFLMWLFGMSPSQAIAFIRRIRPQANPNRGFRSQLLQYERVLHN